MRTWIDENTGRTVRCLGDGPEADRLGYFRLPRLLPGGLFLAYRYGAEQPIRMIDLESGESHPFPYPTKSILNIRLADGRIWYVGEDGASVWTVIFPDGVPELVAQIPSEARAGGDVITCDGRTIIWMESEVDNSEEYPIPDNKDAEMLWRWLDRPRRGRICAYDLETGITTTVVELDGMIPIHHDASPIDPTLLKFSHDRYDAHCQRIWTVRTDGSELTKIRRQEWNELVTHELWWPDGQYIAYKYQDRRNDPTVRALPWAEYSPVPTQFGLASLDGQERYLSDPINHYHTHVFNSLDGTKLSGEGTDGHSFVYAAAFSINNTRIDFVPHATVHTPYRPFRGQKVNAGFSADGHWLIYNDTVEGKLQVCAVEVDL